MTRPAWVGACTLTEAIGITAAAVLGTGMLAGAVLGLLTRRSADDLVETPERPKVPSARAIRPWGGPPAGS